MSHSTIIKIIDLVSFVTLTLMVSTGILIRFTLPPRSGGDAVWSLTRHEWGDIHFYISIVFLALMTVHLITHFKFIKLVITGKASTDKIYRVAIGIISVIALILLSFAPVTSTVTDAHNGNQYRHQNR